MAKVFSCLRDCPPVEGMIYDKVARSWGDFEGIKELTIDELIQLKGLCELQIITKLKEAGVECTQHKS